MREQNENLISFFEDLVEWLVLCPEEWPGAQEPHTCRLGVAEGGFEGKPARSGQGLKSE